MESHDGLIPVSMDPNPVIEAYKKGIDRTLLRENLRLTPQQRFDEMLAALALVEEIRRAREAVRDERDG